MYLVGYRTEDKNHVLLLIDVLPGRGFYLYPTSICLYHQIDEIYIYSVSALQPK